jgi:hypothetical protein
MPPSPPFTNVTASLAEYPEGEQEEKESLLQEEI